LEPWKRAHAVSLTRKRRKNLGWQWQLGGLGCLCKLCKSKCAIETSTCPAAAWLKVNLTVWFLRRPGKEAHQPDHQPLQNGEGREKGIIVIMKTVKQEKETFVRDVPQSLKV